MGLVQYSRPEGQATQRNALSCDSTWRTAGGGPCCAGLVLLSHSLPHRFSLLAWGTWKQRPLHLKTSERQGLGTTYPGPCHPADDTPGPSTVPCFLTRKSGLGNLCLRKDVRKLVFCGLPDLYHARQLWKSCCVRSWCCLISQCFTETTLRQETRTWDLGFYRISAALSWKAYWRVCILFCPRRTLARQL